MNGADTQLWRGWRSDGDEHAFEALVAPHLGFAVDFARRLGARPDQADDVVQDALVTLARERSDKPLRVGIRAWLGRSVATGVKMLRRSEGRRARRERAYERPQPGPHVAAPSVDDAIDVLIRFKALEELNLSETRVTAEGVARLREANPDLEIREP